MRLPSVSIFLLVLAAFAASVARAELATPPKPIPGTRTFTSAELIVPRPDTKPCEVELFGTREFIGEAPAPFAYAPPAGCPGPWARIVIEADYDVTAGRQFDRTALIDVGGINLYFGTTMEPRRDLAQAWHVERDITDYAAYLTEPHDGEARLVNYVDDTYTGHIHGRARLLFYPTAPSAQAPEGPQLIVPLAAHLTRISAEAPVLEASLTLPRNMERVALDLISEPQADDEFWYGCVDDRIAKGRRDVCGGGAFRESEIAIDGELAGVAPIYPWIYTGGINPYLWFPVPGLETVNFTPYRVDLTPFAGRLNDGKPHTIRVGVVGLRNYVFVTGTLLVWRDGGAEVVNGSVTKNTLKPAAINVDGAGLKVTGDGLNGRSLTRARRNYEISGFVDTSHGRVTSRLRQTMRFVNDQTLTASATGQGWLLKQSTRVATRRAVTSAAGTTTVTTDETFPLTVDDRTHVADGVTHEDIGLFQGMRRTTTLVVPGAPVQTTLYEATLMPELHALIDPVTHATSHPESHSVETVHMRTATGHCYKRTITSENDAVVSVSDDLAYADCRP
jgi:hypothetical protein